MKTEGMKRKGAWMRVGFCVVLTCALLISAFALNGIAAGSDAAAADVKVVSCSTHTAALSQGDLYVWGTNGFGQFPTSDLTYSSEPVKVLSGVADVAVADGRTLVVYDSGLLVAFGKDLSTGRAYIRPAALSKNAVKVAASPSFTAYISDEGALYTSGSNASGQLGNGSTEDSEEFVQVFESGVEKVELGNSFALALMEDGSAYGWGSSALCEFGYGEGGADAQPVTEPVLVMEDVADISAGDSHSCFLKTNGTLWTSGSNNFGESGNGLTTAYEPLAQVQDLNKVKSVDAGAYHNFAITENGKVYSWGSDTYGQLGSGDYQSRLVPTEEASMEYVQFFAGKDSTFAVSADGVLSSWGDNTNYLLGKDDGSNSEKPMKILDKDMNWIFLTANEPEVPDEGHTHGGSSVTTPAEDEPQLVATPFISGNGDGTFAPEKEITRAEFLKMVVVALTDFDESRKYGAPSFSDIPLNPWYENVLAYAETYAEPKIASGYEDGTFRPDAKITREEAVKIAAVALNLDLDSAPDAGFTDVTGWSVPYVNAFSTTGALDGDGNGTFSPTRNITRAEAAKIVSVAAGFNVDVVTEETIASVKNPFTDVSSNKWYYPYILRAAGLVG